MAGSNLLTAVSAAPKVLYSGQPSVTTLLQLYTPPSSSSAVIKQGSVCNISGATVNVTLAVIPSGGATDTTHRVISVYPLAAGDTLSLADYLAGCCLGPGDAIYGQTSTANALDFVITGVENT